MARTTFMSFASNETQAQPRLREAQVATCFGTLAKIDIECMAQWSRWLQLG